MWGKKAEFIYVVHVITTVPEDLNAIFHGYATSAILHCCLASPVPILPIDCPCCKAIRNVTLPHIVSCIFYSELHMDL